MYVTRSSTSFIESNVEVVAASQVWSALHSRLTVSLGGDEGDSSGETSVLATIASVTIMADDILQQTQKAAQKLFGMCR